MKLRPSGLRAGHGVKEIHKSGKEISNVDFLTVAEAQKRYGGLEVEVLGSHGSCPDCVKEIQLPDRSMERILREIYPDYRGDKYKD